MQNRAEIPTEPDIQPFRKPPRRLRSEKDGKVQHQVDKLVNKELVEPSTSAWSLPVVLVEKQDGSW